MQAHDLRGLNPAPVTPFTVDGAVDYDAMVDLGKWLAGFDEVKSLVVLGHAGEGTFLTQDEQVKVIRTLAEELPDTPIIAGIAGPWWAPAASTIRSPSILSRWRAAPRRRGSPARSRGRRVRHLAR